MDKHKHKREKAVHLFRQQYAAIVTDTSKNTQLKVDIALRSYIYQNRRIRCKKNFKYLYLNDYIHCGSRNTWIIMRS